MNGDEEDVEAGQQGVSLSDRFFLLLVLGFLMVVVGVIFLLVAAVLYDSSVSGSAIIFIGPFPIVIGAGPEAEWLILVGIVLAVLSVIIFFVMNRKMRKFRV